MKKCPFCGADIEDSARFCLYCMQALTEKEQILPYKKKKPQWIIIIAAVVTVFLILAILLLSTVLGTSSQSPDLNSTSPSSTPTSTTAQTEPSTQPATNPSTPPTSEPTTPPVTVPPSQAHVHSYSVANTTIEYQKEGATCTAPAVYYYSCLCGKKGNDTFSYGETANHTIVTDPGYPATCVNPGLTDGSHCSVCNTVILSQTQTPVINHTFDNDRDEICNVCNYVRALNCNHAETVALAAVSPTCTAGGLTEGRKCALCEEILTAQSALAPLGHTEVADQAVPATCTTPGKTEGVHCSVCKTVIKAQTTINALGHKEVVFAEALPATCTTSGQTEGTYCSVCKTIMKAQTTINALGHKEVVYAEAVPATCAFSGKTEGTRCSVCKTVIKAQTTIKALGHNEVVYAEAVPSTCTTRGTSEGIKCSVCEEIFSTPLPQPVLGHSFAVEKSPSVCLDCGERETLTIVAPQFPIVVNNTFRIDSATYNIRPFVDGKFYIEFTFYGTNISSATTLFCPYVSIYGPENAALGCSLGRYLKPNESGPYLAAAQISNHTGTYHLVFK